MSKFLTQLKMPVLIGTLLVLPFMLLEWLNRREYHENYPVPLYLIMWLLPVVFIYALAFIVRNLRAGHKTIKHRLAGLLWLALAILLVWLWAGTIADQMPCFLGVPVCD